MKTRRTKRRLYEAVEFDPLSLHKHARITHIRNDPRTADAGGGDTGTRTDIVRFLESQGFVKHSDGVYRR